MPEPSRPSDTVVAVRWLAAYQFGGNPMTIDPDAPVQELGADSLGFLKFYYELEEHFGVSISREEVTNVRTLRELAELIDRQLSTSRSR